MKTLPLFLLSLFFLGSCSRPQTKDYVYKLDPKTWPTKTIALDQMISEMRMIPLETKPECLIGEIKGFSQNKSGFYILTKDMKVFHYDPAGRFIWSIDRKGKGPGEYGYLWGFTLTDQELILMDSPGKKLIFFDLSGKYRRELTNVPAGFAIAYLSNKKVAIYYGRAFHAKENRHELTILDLNEMTEKTFFPYEKDEGMGMFSSFTLGSGNKVLFHPELDPTVYEITPEVIDTLIRFDFLQARVHSFREYGLAADYVGIRKIVDTKNAFIAQLQSKSESYLWLLDHISGNTRLFYVDYGPGLGIYHGFQVNPPAWSNPDEFIYSGDAVQMKEILGKIDPDNLAWLRKNVPGFSNLEKMKEDDNPVLVLYKFGEF